MRSINDRLQEMTEKINSGNVLESSGLGNEINFRVFDYDPEDEYVVRDYLYNYLLVRNKNIIVFDIYDIIIDILKEKGFLEKTFEYEKKKGAKYVNSVIQKTLAISSNSDLIVKYIREHIEENKDTKNNTDELNRVHNTDDQDSQYTNPNNPDRVNENMGDNNGN